jgi:hypothetical protein
MDNQSETTDRQSKRRGFFDRPGGVDFWMNAGGRFLGGLIIGFGLGVRQAEGRRVVRGTQLAMEHRHLDGLVRDRPRHHPSRHPPQHRARNCAIGDVIIVSQFLSRADNDHWQDREQRLRTWTRFGTRS